MSYLLLPGASPGEERRAEAGSAWLGATGSFSLWGGEKGGRDEQEGPHLHSTCTGLGTRRRNSPFRRRCGQSPVGQHSAAQSRILPQPLGSWQQQQFSPRQVTSRCGKVSLGMADTLKHPAQNLLFLLLPFPEKKRHRFLLLPPLRRIPRSPVLRHLRLHKGCWVQWFAGHVLGQATSLFVRPWQTICFHNTKELCSPP